MANINPSQPPSSNPNTSTISATFTETITAVTTSVSPSIISPTSLSHQLFPQLYIPNSNISFAPSSIPHIPLSSMTSVSQQIPMSNATSNSTIVPFPTQIKPHQNQLLYPLIPMLKPLLNLPPPIITLAHQLVSDYWNRQDQLLRSAIIASLSSDIVQQVLASDTTYAVWQTLYNLYARPSRARLLGLKESLANAQKGTQSMTSYLQNIKYLVTTLNSAWSTLTMDDITLHVLHGLPSEYNGIADALRTRDTSVSFDELYEKLVDYEAYLQCKSISVSSPVTVNAVTCANNSFATRINKNPRPSNGQGQSTGSNHAPQSGN
ncbi:hypothetical protein GH714_003121 [Hevea brasiliensis]|uniref:Retrotransposon gag domain-containing protein n=1 Tax=Hevea brasiliensis TaxID=3981 RepID=A0A6A6LYU7_HEVBR|nr:hypothetical protein GH714_003121 [Hevea brasiliensis]